MALSCYSIGPDDAALSFAQRLARENGWTSAHTERVIDEYRRFVFLAMTAGHAVTPSDAVDQVWHLHLTYTRDYWDRFCPDVLGEPRCITVPRRAASTSAIDTSHNMRQRSKAMSAYLAPPRLPIFGHLPPNALSTTPKLAASTRATA